MTESSATLRTRPCPVCDVCGGKGKPLYSGLADHLFGVPGSWDLKVCTNVACGLMWLDPMPIMEDLARAYETYHTHADGDADADSGSALRRIYRWAREGYRAIHYNYPCDSFGKKLLGLMLSLFPGRAEDAGFCAMYLPAMPGGRLLEVGCGTGQMLLAMKDLGWSVEGIDFDPEAVRNASLKGLDVRLGDLAQQGYGDGVFDAIFMSHVIEHVPDPRALLDECFRILKPGGYLVVVTPNGAGWGSRLYGSHWRGIEPPRHLHIFTPAALSMVADRAGFLGARARSSARARGMFLASEQLRRGETHVEERRPPLYLMLWAELMGFLEWLRIFWDRNAGEEAVLLVRKGSV